MDPIAELSTAVDFWKSARIWVGVPTLILAVATFISQWMELKKSRELSVLQREQLKKKDDQLQSELRTKDVQIANANRASSEASAEAAKAMLEQEKLRAQLAWRRVSAAQAATLHYNLMGHGIELWLSFVKSDPECVIFREDLNGALQAAGVKTKFYSGYMRAVGLSVRGGDPDQRKIILAAFNRAGIPIFEDSEAGMFDNKLEILVGSKPPADFYK